MSAADVDQSTVLQEMAGYVGGLSPVDWEILRAMEPIVHAIAKAFGANCEVLLHSLEDLSNSVIVIANGHVTGRQVGAPVTDLAMRILRDVGSGGGDVVGPYVSKTADGRHLKSVTTIVRNQQGRPIGLLCINVNISAPLVEVIRDFLCETIADEGESPENFATSAEDLIRRSLDAVHATIAPERKMAPITKNKLIVSKLYDRGIFDIRGAVSYVAREMGVSKYTIYNYLREIRQE